MFMYNAKYSDTKTMLCLEYKNIYFQVSLSLCLFNGGFVDFAQSQH